MPMTSVARSAGSAIFGFDTGAYAPGICRAFRAPVLHFLFEITVLYAVSVDASISRFFLLGARSTWLALVIRRGPRR